MEQLDYVDCGTFSRPRIVPTAVMRQPQTARGHYSCCEAAGSVPAAVRCMHACCSVWSAALLMAVYNWPSGAQRWNKQPVGGLGTCRALRYTVLCDQLVRSSRRATRRCGALTIDGVHGSTTLVGTEAKTRKAVQTTQAMRFLSCVKREPAETQVWSKRL